MKAIVSHGIQDFRLEECPMPEVGAGDVLIEVRYCGICGTDVHQYHGNWELNVGATPGHEISGVVRGVGDGVQSVKAGDRVTLDPGIPCGRCEFCRSARTHLCPNRYAIFHYRRGGFAEYTVAMERQVYRLPDEVPMDCGAFFEPASCCVHAIDRAEIKPGQTVAVLGGGPIGLMLTQLALHSGASRVVVSEPQEKRRRLAEKLGAAATVNPAAGDAVEAVKDAAGGPVDVVIESAGLAVTVSQCFEVVKRGGRIVFFGVCEPNARVEFSPYFVFRNEITVLGSLMAHDVFPRTLKLLASETLRVKPLIYPVMPLESFMDALMMHERHEGLKILVTPQAHE